MNARYAADQPSVRPGFTLIELLVVIAIIAILAGLLLPSLASAKGQSKRVRCTSNQKQLGIAFHLYADENNEKYPVSPSWSAIGGMKGTNASYTSNIYDWTNRLLNRYAGTPEVYHCPADHGDSLNGGVASAFYGYGTSYLVEWNGNNFRVQKVSGNSLTPGTTSFDSIRTGDIAVASASKIIQGDWVWHLNRDLTDPHNQWHSYKGRRVVNFLYGDGHVDYYEMPQIATNWISAPAPDPAFTWW